MINHKYKCIFIHPNKCGGTSIEFHFAKKRRGIVDHSSLVSWQQDHPEEYKQYFKFGYVRNPWDRLVSDYHYSIQRKRGEGSNRGVSEGEQMAKRSFADNMKDKNTRLNKRNKPVMSKRWFLDEDGKLGLDYVGRFENFNEDFKYICTQIGAEVMLPPHIKKSNHRPYWEYYDDESREIVARKFHKDIEHFGYEFGK